MAEEPVAWLSRTVPAPGIPGRRRGTALREAMTSRWPPLEHSGQPRQLDPTGSPEPDLTPTPPIELGGIVAGKYRIDRVIGFGGMGIVCAAQHLELGTPVAVKFVRPERAADERAAARHAAVSSSS